MSITLKTWAMSISILVMGAMVASALPTQTSTHQVVVSQQS